MPLPAIKILEEMKIKEAWTIELKNGAYGGLKPIIDPFDKNRFYLSDGWGSAFPSIKLRQLSFSDGKELNSVSIKNIVRCLYFNSDGRNMFAVSDNKIFQIDRINLSIIKKFDKGIQRYSDYISSNNKDSLLLMNYNSDYLCVYNYLTEKGIKKKLKSCKGIIQGETPDTFLIFCPKTGTVLKYYLMENKLEEIIRTDIYYSTWKGNSGTFYFHLGKIVEATSNTHEHIVPTNKIITISANQPNLTNEIILDAEYRKFWISENEELMYLNNVNFMKRNQISIYSLKEKRIIDTLNINKGEQIIELFDDKGVALSYNIENPKKITCWKYE